MEFVLWALVAVLWILKAYFWMIIATVAISWLIGFGILNMSNKMVEKIVLGITKFTEPPLQAVRNVLPGLGGIDFSPIVIVLALNGLMLAVQKTILYLVGYAG